MDQMDDQSKILSQARQQLEALKQAGLGRDDLLAPPEEESQQQQQQQHIPPVEPDGTSLSIAHDDKAFSLPRFSVGSLPQYYRSSVSTISSSSSRDSCLSATSVRSSISSTSNSSTSNPLSQSKFWCTCCSKTFKRKFDWKRHQEEFHERSRKYPCDICNQSFWGPNIFNQHHKSAHGCQTCPHADMVMKQMKIRRAYSCGFCAALHIQFERHIDHVATHFENGMTKQDWSHSNVIYGLLHQHGIRKPWKALVASKYNRFNDRQPMFGWSPESTGRAHGFTDDENENPGQLQDLLEFFDGSKKSAKKIVQLADTCVHVVLRPKSSPPSPAIATGSMPSLSVTGSGPYQGSISRSSIVRANMGVERRPQLPLLTRLIRGSVKPYPQALLSYPDDTEASSNVSKPSMTSQALARDIHTSDNFYLTSQEEWSQLPLKQSIQPFEDSRNPPPLANIADDLTSDTANFEAAAEGRLPPNSAVALKKDIRGMAELWRDYSSDSESSSAGSSVQAGSTEPFSLSYGAAMDGGDITKPGGGDLIQEDDDIQSISSIPHDIVSSAESSSTIQDYRQAVVNYLVKVFIDDSELLALYRNATNRMDESTFLWNHRGLLKRYFLDLQSEGGTPSQKLAVRFLRLRSERIHTSSMIRRIVMPSNNTILEKASITLQQEDDKLALLDRWLGQQGSTNIVEEAGTASDNSDDSDDDSDISNGAVVAQINHDWTLSKLEATAEFLVTGRPFSLYKENLRRFLHPGPEAQENLQKDVAQTSTSMLEQSSEAMQREVLEPVVLSPTTSNADEKQSTEQSACRKNTWNASYLSRCLSWLRRITMPKLKVGHRRIEWKCDCGADLYADFPNNGGEQLDNLAFSLQNLGQTNTNQASNIPLEPLNAFTPNSLGNTLKEGANKVKKHMDNLTKRYPTATTTSSSSSQVDIGRPKFLALCVNTGGIYKTLAEIDTSSMTSDSAAFSIMKDEYFKTRGLRSRFKLLIKPTTIEFVQFTLWNRRGAYISVCNRPNCIPPDDSNDYEYCPKPLSPLLPMPAEIFIHYLEHGEGDLNPIRNDWLPRLPKRLDKRVIDGNESCFGWGIHVIEGPNREVIFWIAMLTILASVLTSVLWSTLQNDVQGGAGLGALIVALPPAILTAFLFKLEGI